MVNICSLLPLTHSSSKVNSPHVYGTIEQLLIPFNFNLCLFQVFTCMYPCIYLQSYDIINNLITYFCGTICMYIYIYHMVQSLCIYSIYISYCLDLRHITCLSAKFFGSIGYTSPWESLRREEPWAMILAEN